MQKLFKIIIEDLSETLSGGNLPSIAQLTNIQKLTDIINSRSYCDTPQPPAFITTDTKMYTTTVRYTVPGPEIYHWPS